MTIAYISYPPFLDFAIEPLYMLKSRVNLNVYIVLNTFFFKTTVLNISNYPYPVGKLIQLENLRNHVEHYDQLEAYFKGCASVNFILFPDKYLSFATVSACKTLAKAVNKANADVVHIDDAHLHFSPLRIFLKSKNILLNIHDPERHSGEQSWRSELARKVMYPMAKGYALFSAYSKTRFEEINHPKQKTYQLALTPYYFVPKLEQQAIDLNIAPDDFVLLFFGRISPYKGISELLSAFDSIHKKYPKLKLIVAGKGKLPEDYQLSEALKAEGSNRLTVLNRFITNGELVYLMQNSNVVICPYRDATQSGVVMTAFGFNKPVIVSEVGGLHEPIIAGKNGLTYSLSAPKGLENAIEALINAEIEPAPFAIKEENTPQYNTERLLNIYQELANN